MTGGSRSRTGCLTCRIRKKKCDERRPVCEACRSRKLTCYGYDTSAPSWYTSKANWGEVMRSDEAKSLRALAETRYKIQRKLGWKGDIAETGSISSNVEGEENYNPFQLPSRSITENFVTSSSFLSSRADATKNIWQLHPETMWWDSKIRSLAPDNGSFSRNDTRWLILFLDVIHPITHTFYKLSSSEDRSWLLNRLIGDRALYSACLSVSACFDHSLTQQPKINDIGICPEVRILQSTAVHELHTRIDKFANTNITSLQDFICTGIGLLDIVLNLLNLEVFSMLQGFWEMHHQAARALLNHIESCYVLQRGKSKEKKVSAIEFARSTLPLSDQRRRSLDFCITNFVWIDIVAIATFGLLTYTPPAFDHLRLLEIGVIKPQYIMGCQGWIMAIIVEIMRLEAWQSMQRDKIRTQNATAEFIQRGNQLSDKLVSGIERLEKGQHGSTTPIATSLEEDIRVVSIVWAHAAQILLQVLIFDSEATGPYINQALIDTCLQKLEELPTRLVMRVNWPYTIAGCLSMYESRHERFRGILAKTMQQSQAPGLTWKGLMVMEECWRLQHVHPYSRIGWKEAMDSLSARVLLM